MKLLFNFPVRLLSINLHVSEMIVLNIDFGAFWNDNWKILTY